MASIVTLSQQYREEQAKSRPTTNRLDEWRGRPGPALAKLLEREGVPIALAYCDSPGFRRLARWPLETLLPGSETAERRLIENLQQEIATACALVRQFVDEYRELLDKYFPAAVRRWRILQSPPPVRSSEGVEVVDTEVPRPMPSVADVLAMLDGVEAQCKMEWVSATDYFGPQYRVWVKDGDEEILQQGAYVVALNPQLRYVGNHIARCLLVRAAQAVETLQTCVQELKVTIVAAQVSLAIPYGAAAQRICQQLESLRQSCLHTRDAQLAEAAMSLVQIAVGFARNTPPLDWLPKEATQFARPGNVQWALASRRDPKTAQVIQESLDLLKAWEANRAPDESLRDAAIATGGLVLLTGSREVYWDQQPVLDKWKACNRQWQLLLALAKSRGLCGVSLADLYGDKEVGETAFTRAKNKLCMMLPEALRTQITAVNVAGQLHYQLGLPSQSIHVL